MVDDPYLFGQITAANALSDIYAMGAVPTHALNLLCFPDCLAVEIVKEILHGGADKAAEAGCVIAGGHTIVDQAPKYGLCVSGIVRPDRILLNSSAKCGDVLVLTKSLGTGILITARKADFLSLEAFRPATSSMCSLNKKAAEAVAGFGVHACTDITGFGFIGHLCEMADASGLTAVIDPGKVPILPFACGMARLGMVPEGAYRNREHFEGKVSLTGIELELSDILFDPQTSGGLLFAVAESDAVSLVSRLKETGVDGSVVGFLTAREDVSIRVVR